VFHRRRFFQGRAIRGLLDLGWYRPDGGEMTDEDWDAGFSKAVAVVLNGEAITDRDLRGQPVTDGMFALLFNAHHEAIEWKLPLELATAWVVVLDTAEDTAGRLTDPGGPAVVEGRSVLVLQKRGDPTT
jgi:glycogen operon protein